jgi:hypothetical protein
MGALIVGGDLEAGAGAGRVLLEDQRDVPAREAGDLVARGFRRLELGREPQQKADLLRREIIQRCGCSD